MKSQAHKVPKGHQVPGHEVPAGVDRWAAGVGRRWPGERPGAPDGESLGLWRTDRCSDASWDAFWMDFGGPHRPKLSSRLSETLILIKSPFSPRVGFFYEKSSPQGS